MFSELVELMFNDFANANGLLVKKETNNYVLLVDNDFDIVVSYDEREDEVFTGFDLSRYLERLRYPDDLQFPMFLSIGNVCEHWGIKVGISNDKNLSLEDRVLLKLKQLEIIWHTFVGRQNFKDILAELLLGERIKLKEATDLQKLNSLIGKAHDFFKLKDYKRTVELLTPHIDKLSEYDKKIFEYSLKKMSVT